MRIRIPLFMSLLLLILSYGSPCSAQTFWARTQAGANIDETLAVSGDNTGNAFSTGYFSTTASITEVNLSTAGLTDIFVTRVNANGSNGWSVRAGGTGSDRGLGIDTDPSGNVLVSGFFSGTASFGNGISLTANGSSQDAFVAKYSPAGIVLWARAGGSSGNGDRANAVTSDASGNVIITGQFSGEASFGPLSVSATGGSNDVFVVKYSPNGDELWAKSGNGTGLNRGLGITADAGGAIYACGQFSGNIEFDNVYTNSVLNALFVVKYGAGGTEEWMRFAGGSAQSIAYGITSNGSNIYLTGDCGQNLTFINAPGNPSINTGFEQSVFIACFNNTGGYLWGSSQGSDSPVSARGISHHNGQLGVAGWYECTFESLSAQYGESTFNNIGFRDVYVMRYSTAGAFQWARNFGSQTAEVASGIHILPDNLEVVVGTFNGNMIIPIRDTQSGNGMQALSATPNAGITYCGDSNYGDFSAFQGSFGEDGFMVKAIDLERQPYDYYDRPGSGCDLSIPDACISYGTPGTSNFQCEEVVEGCPGFNITGTNFASFGPPAVGYGFNVSWSNNATGVGTIVNNPGTYTITYTSLDGCYSTTASVLAETYPAPTPPIITDSQGVNTGNLSTFPVFICPGETVDLTATAAINGTWAGTGVPPGQASQSTITIGSPGTYVHTIIGVDGCPASNSILVILHPPPPPPIQPYLFFEFEGDTIFLCENNGVAAFVLDSLTGQTVPAAPYDWSWSISPTGSISGFNVGLPNFPVEGWYEITVTIEGDDTPCEEVDAIYVLSDSVYVLIGENPIAEVSLTGPNQICPGDSLWLQVTSNLPNFTTLPANLFIDGNSVLVTGPGTYTVFVSVTTEEGCVAVDNATIVVEEVSTPAIFSSPDPAIICPGESVSLGTDAEGDFTWQGPSGIIGDTPIITATEAGLYYVEVDFYPGCSLVSNTLQVSEYATPFISAENAVLCEGGSVEIEVVSTAGGNILWLPPLSGNAPSQVITDPGVYAVEVTACNITTLASIEVVLSNSSLSIFGNTETPVCEGDSIFVEATGGHFDYQWTGAESDNSEVWVFETGNVQAAAVDSFGCDLLSNVLTFSFDPSPPAPSFVFDPPCFGDPLELSVSDPFTVTWLSGLNGDPIFTGSTVSVDSLVADTVFYAQLTSALCPGPPAGVAISPKPLPGAPISATDAPVCTGTAFTLSVLNPELGVVYNWFSNIGSFGAGVDVQVFAESMALAGNYSVVGNLDGCRGDTSTVEVELIRTRQVSLRPDTALCLQSELILKADTIFVDYLWQDGSTATEYIPEESGIYFLQVTDFNGCKSQALVNIELVDCSITFPNIFTPNGDGINDLWFLSVSKPLFFKVLVYNRWGNLVYESFSVGNWWDGNHFQTGEPCSEGVYFYIAEINSFESVSYSLTGNVTLMRENRP